MLIVSFWLVKGIVSYGLIKGDIWAYKLGLIDAGASTFLYIVAAIHPFIYFNPGVTRTLSLSEILFFLMYFLFMRSKNKSISTLKTMNLSVSERFGKQR